MPAHTAPFDTDPAAAPVCQHCGHEVAWSSTPADAGYKAFTHVATNTIACA